MRDTHGLRTRTASGRCARRGATHGARGCRVQGGLRTLHRGRPTGKGRRGTGGGPMTMRFWMAAVLVAGPVAGTALGATAQVVSVARHDVSPPLRDLVEAAREAPLVAGPDREVP